MALTKTEAAKLSNSMLLRGVIETMVKESPILTWLPFLEVTGRAVTYNREASTPDVTFYAPGDTWTEATPTFQTVSTSLAVLGGDADVDNFLQATYADANDIEAEVIANRAKAVAYAFSDAFFNGDPGTDPNSFAGIDSLVTGAQALSMEQTVPH